MNEKDKVFFGKDGLTASSANHICTLCAEKVRELSAYVEGISLLNKDLEIPATATSTRLHCGMGDGELQHLQESLDKIGDYHSLQAWLMEAIKAKDRATNEIKDISYSVWQELCDIDEDERPEFSTKLVAPREKTTVTADEVVAKWSVKDRMRMIELGSRAAVYGKYIGVEKAKYGTPTKGAYAKAREEYFSRHQNPVDVTGEGQDVTITRYTESVSQSTEEQVFFSMQQKHRSLNAELNAMLHRIEVEGNAEATRLTAEYKTARAEYEAAYAEEQAAYNQQLTEWNNRHKALTLQWQEWRKQQLEEIQALRIVIPNALLDTYNSLK